MLVFICINDSNDWWDDDLCVFGNSIVKCENIGGFYRFVGVLCVWEIYVFGRSVYWY